MDSRKCGTITECRGVYGYNKLIMKEIQVTQEEIRMATRPNIYKNKKKYNRKSKHKNHLNQKQNEDN